MLHDMLHWCTSGSVCKSKQSLLQLNAGSNNPVHLTHYETTQPVFNGKHAVATNLNIVHAVTVHVTRSLVL